MTLKEIVTLLDATVLCGNLALDKEVFSAFASDLMSDVLAFVKENTLLITGLVNNQSIRTAEMLDLPCIVFVRGKTPSAEVLEMAEEMELPVLTTAYSMYDACGKLFAAGLASAKIR